MMAPLFCAVCGYLRDRMAQPLLEGWNVKIVAVTRILNEDDIVEAFVRHRATIVDHHIFLDNGSTDDTLGILSALKDEGLNLSVVQNQTAFFAEVNYNTALFRSARTAFAADWVLFLDTDEFVDTRQASGGLRPLMETLPDAVDCLGLPSFTYFDLAHDDRQEPVVPSRMRSRERVPQHSVSKLWVRGRLADAGVTIDAGQHYALADGQPIVSHAGHGVVLGHYYRRSAWQEISKSVVGYLKVAAAPKLERDKDRSAHYQGVFAKLRDEPEALFSPSFFTPTYDERDLVEDPLPYLGGPLRYTQIADPKLKAVRVLLAYAEQLAQSHAGFIDTNEGVRLQAEQSTYAWTHLF